MGLTLPPPDRTGVYEVNVQCSDYLGSRFYRKPAPAWVYGTVWAGLAMRSGSVWHGWANGGVSL